MRGLNWLAATALLLSGCGGDGDSNGDGGADEPTAGAKSSEAVARTLKDTCPLLEQATPSGLMPSNARLMKYANDLGALTSEGDTESQNAITFLQDATQALLTAGPGTEYADAFGQFTEAVQTVADRCATVGSSAFQ